MDKKIWIAAGIAGMLAGLPQSEAKAEVNLHISAGDRPSFVIDRRPDFIALPEQGFSVSVGSPYDIIFYGNTYYLYNEGRWYRSSHYRGPWIITHENRLPRNIRRHRWEDIRRYRDTEYRRHDRRDEHRDERRDNRRDERNDRRPDEGGRRN
ncbi:MAG: hypothetical protein WCH05_09715 [Chlorobiaceae bacterium]